MSARDWRPPRTHASSRKKIFRLERLPASCTPVPGRAQPLGPLAARHGLEANIRWLAQRQPQAIDRLILEQLLPAAEQALLQQGLEPQSVHRYLAIIDQRVRAHDSGAQWQRQQHRGGASAQSIVMRYQHWQDSGLPVHLWTP